MKRSLRLSLAAREDIVEVLRYTESRFGPSLRGRYQGLLFGAFSALIQEPARIGSKAREELGAGLRSLHLAYCRSEARTAKVARPRHIVFYRLGNDLAVEVVRVLHESMDLERHLPKG
ncbi:type II toxin-antitoxin system RelE/ParE family toxin [Pseudomonas citronellolis]|uniref:type II toxin-antitoxin system RelE/ParE family toxin n=1 Tax=Pseudomonas citronellolis TaxID=53408 RepID=UPI0023E3A673|nr:type II toxin-antitoxin system RelE/ParE family toxin [Pseudomonas citronellolis]MDF3934894.1 type II toxin-antitoxin system RelE/ParE family toxin [Pseudomonas citronellolis]